jgi:hypothetical protein
LKSLKGNVSHGPTQFVAGDPPRGEPFRNLREWGANAALIAAIDVGMKSIMGGG